MNDISTEIEEIRERSARTTLPVCSNCRQPLTKIAATAAGPTYPPDSVFTTTYTEWMHTHNHELWCDGHSGRYAKESVKPGNPDALVLLAEIDRLRALLIAPSDIVQAATDVIADACRDGAEGSPSEIAQALADAGILPTESEWAIDRKTFTNGEFDDRVYRPHFMHRPFTEDEARKDVAMRTGENGQYTPDTMRVVSRLVAPWKAS